MALYGLKSSGAAFMALLAERLDKMGLKSGIVDPYVWIRPAIKADGENYYEFIFVYIDDLFAISQYAVSATRKVSEKLKSEKDKIDPHEIYLGGRLVRKEFNDNQLWTISRVDYVNAVFKNL